MKDNFSKQATTYAKFRPGYPPELYDFLLSLVSSRKCAWDCATGNGQVAAVLSEYFDEVYATDISANQISNAVKKENIFYSLAPAEETFFDDNKFDLITIGQALHWFSFEKFYKEVNRTLKKDGCIAAFGYGLFRINEEIDEIIDDFYKNVTGPYWDEERKYIDDNYETIPFPFKEIKAPVLQSSYRWPLGHVIGFLNSWSAVQHYIKQHQKNPVSILEEKLGKVWEANSEKEITFPIFIKVGRK